MSAPAPAGGGAGAAGGRGAPPAPGRPPRLPAADEAARAFAALGDPTRLELVRRLGNAPRLNVTQLTAGVGVSRQAVSKHLAVLQGAGLVSRERAGRETLFELRRDSVAAAGDYLRRVSEAWDAAIERLRAHVEEA
ncbi:MAG TPA: metalloregulator ArsR/SmtB family transcription factor [Trueperaceae bacterium]|nr:metalloregulator ArsR/SmtB family transcription factor [Trueperaceae bacterium]